MFKFFNRKRSNDTAYVPEDYAVKKSRRARAFFWLSLVAVFLVFIAASWLVLRAPFFRVENIDIVGNESVPEGDILGLALSSVIGESYFDKLLGIDHFLNWPDAFPADKLRFLPALKSVAIEKDYQKNRVVISAVEREPYGIWCLASPQIDADKANTAQINADASENISENQRRNPRESAPPGCWWFDDEGIIFKKAARARGSLIPAVFDYSQGGPGLGGKILSEEMMPALLSVFDVLRASGLAVKEVKLNDIELEELEIFTFNGPKIYFSLRFSAHENAMAVLKDFMSKKGFDDLQYVDFRVENRVYYK